jgi:competence protein ComEC
MGSFFLVVKMDTIKNSENQPITLSKITMIPDTIQVNGDLLSFQGKERGQNYQVYETLKRTNILSKSKSKLSAEFHRKPSNSRKTKKF